MSEPEEDSDMEVHKLIILSLLSCTFLSHFTDYDCKRAEAGNEQEVPVDEHHQRNFLGTFVMFLHILRLAF